MVKDLINKAQIALIDVRLKGENHIKFFRKNIERSFSKKLKADIELVLLSNKFVVNFIRSVL